MFEFALFDVNLLESSEVFQPNASILLSYGGINRILFYYTVNNFRNEQKNVDRTVKKIDELPNFESLPLCRRPILSSVGSKSFVAFVSNFFKFRRCHMVSQHHHRSLPKFRQMLIGFVDHVQSLNGFVQFLMVP